VVLREHNVEHRLLARLADVSPSPLRALLRLESRLVARAEARACTLADTVAAISEVDAVALRELAPAARITVLPAAYPAQRSAIKTRLEGSPPFLAFGSFDWHANRDGALWLLREVWPRIRALAPAAALHLAGPGSCSLTARAADGIIRHGQVPDDSALCDPRSVFLVPVRAGSGVRLRLLTAWSEELPAVTTPLGGEGLVSSDGEGALLAATPEEFARAAVRLAADGELRQCVIAAGRRLIANHSPARVADAALEIYREAIAGFGARDGRQAVAWRRRRS
jgi:glycosyltransferase involved in cell wall biosynthesis